MSAPSTYLAWQQSASFSKIEWNSPTLAENLALKTLQAPNTSALAPKTTLVRLHAAALNFRDLLTIAQSSLYPTPLEVGNAPGSDGAGEIIATGSSSSWRTGDRVVLAPNTWRSGPDQRDFKFESTLGATVQGTLKQLAVVGDAYLVKAPANATFEEATCLPTAGVTAYRALFGEVEGQADGLKAGDWVLTQGTGGVSLWAVQIAVAAGAKVIATSSSDAKLEIARRLGAIHTINYTTHPDWHEEALRLTSGRGVDRVVEVGGSATILKSLKSTRFGGLVVVIGVLSDGDEKGIIAEILFGAKTVKGILGGSKDVLERLASFVEEHGIRPVIGGSFRLEEGQDAVRALQKQDTVGKIVISL